MYQPRTYRRWVKYDDLVCFRAVVRETDLQVRAVRNLKAATLKAIAKHRAPLEEYIQSHPLFLGSLEPLAVEEDAPPIIREMAEVGLAAGVGPMAAVAGAIAEAVGKELLACSPEVIVENGGDIWVRSSKTRLIGVYAGDSPFTGKIALEIAPEQTPAGICTSSGTVGHSLSFGGADAVIALSPSAALADAAATAIGNLVKATEDIAPAVEQAQYIKGLTGVTIIKGDRIGLWGNVKLVSL